MWLIFGGVLIAFLYFGMGLVMCITLIGIPFGLPLFKLGSYVMWPFGHELVDGPGQPGCLNVGLNLLWILLGWWEIALAHLICGLFFCIKIVGIPLGLRHFRIAIASVFPFGKQIQ